ncbi:MAG: PKD domain-containing protein [Bacteroidetes bacterium]|nr:PKD domain-containing protein [Bacteroidota bacterium]
MKQILIVICCINLVFFSEMQAQVVVNDTVTRTAPVFYDVLGNEVTFGAEMPPVNQVAGAPKAFYTYYWEFGDGAYSFEEKPKHHYAQSGEYEVKLWSTNHYDNGKPPESRPKKVAVNFNEEAANEMATSDGNSPFVEDDDLFVKTNRDALPNQDIVLITSYKNTKDYVTDGKLYLFYNDTQFKNNNFILEDTRLHHGEQISSEVLFATSTEVNDTHSYLANDDTTLLIQRRAVEDTTKRAVLPATLDESEALYRDYQVIQFQNMQPGEERNIFRTLKTTPEMLKDTSAIVSLRSIYVPDENFGSHTVKDTEIEIVTSHDPNKMSSNGTIMNYRWARLKRLKFKVRFQNDGEGPANTIRLEVDTPEMFDKETLQIRDMYPKCAICPKGREVNYSCLDTVLKQDKIIFTFKKIYLPGTAQKGVTEKDSTKGFVKYSMKFGDKFHKTKTRSRTAIYFDKNEPILTNYSTTRFLPGISLGAKAGYIFNPDLDNSKEYFAGITLSPFKSYRGYLQAELFFSANSFESLRNFESVNLNEIGISEINRFTEANKENGITTYLVPISYRYNLNNFVAIGAGIQLKMDLSSTCLSETTGEFSLDIPGEGEIRDPSQDTFQRIECDESFSNFQSGLFLGANVGGVRIGPSVGVRYVFNFNEPTSQVQVYGIWKF